MNTTSPLKPCTGVILAGGKSARMGQNKALLRIHGTTFIERAVQLLSSVCVQTLVIDNEDLCSQGIVLAPAQTYHDSAEFKGLGPLAGIYTGLSLAQNDACCVLTCDMPLVDRALLLHLFEHADPAKDVTCFRSSLGHHEPFPGIYRRRSLSQLHSKLSANCLSLCHYLEGDSARMLAIPDQHAAKFANTNTPCEYEQLLAAAAHL